MTYGEALAEGRAALASVANASLDARLLLAAAAGLDMAALVARSGDVMPTIAQTRYDTYLKRRSSGEPVARILGRAEFWGLDLKLNSATLVPRPDTETLVEVVLEEAHRLPAALTICDLGTGSGAIAIALLSELKEARAFATDISDGGARRGAIERASARCRRPHKLLEGRLCAKVRTGRSTWSSRTRLISGARRSTACRETCASTIRALRLTAAKTGLPPTGRSCRGSERCSLGAASSLSKWASTKANRSLPSAAMRVFPTLPFVATLPGASASLARAKPCLGPTRRWQKKRLEKSNDRASFQTQTRAKPQSWHSFPGRQRTKSRRKLVRSRRHRMDVLTFGKTRSARKQTRQALTESGP